MEKRVRRDLVIGICFFLILLYLTSFNSQASLIFVTLGGKMGFSFASLVLAIATILLFYWGDVFFGINFRIRHYLFMTFIASCSFSSLYFSIISYDKILHFVEPLMAASIIFFMMKGWKIKPVWKLMLTFFVIAGILGSFELVEFGLDSFFNLNTQGVFIAEASGKLITIMDPNTDTMVDMLTGYVGILLYVIPMHFYLKRKKRKR